MGRDTGKDQFAQHVDALGKFNLLDEFVWCWTNAREVLPQITQAAAPLQPDRDAIVLARIRRPKTGSIALENHASEYAQSLGAPDLATLLAHLRQAV